MGSYPIYIQHCKHTSIFHVLHSGVCMSVSWPEGWISGASSSYPPWEQTWSKYGPQSWWEPGRAWASASTLAPEACVCADVHVCIYVHGESLCKYVQGVGSHHRSRGAGLLEARPAWGGWLTGGFPQVSGCCDGVALRSHLLGTQRLQPELLEVHMTALGCTSGASM